MQLSRLITWLCFLACLGSIPSPTAAAERVRFNRDIRPILSDHCYACHGPDQKALKASLRLDLKQGLFEPLKSGEVAVVPGRLDESELLRRIVHGDEDEVMPPKKAGKPLTTEQIALFRRWVEEGADWQGHWAYVKPEHVEPPEVRDPDWAVNEIDGFVLARLEKEGLPPSAPASKEKLIRRAALDLTGLPPTIEEIDRFLADESPKAYEQVVDRLLESKAYGERQAMFWLDLARYGETQGYHHDAHRDMWHWRDWVIDAFNKNMPFDQFTVEQLAGDLLPEPTRDQLIATGFHRNEMTTSEGGALPEEYAVKYVAGRVDTTARVWMGTSMACAECHDHKYDPIKQKDYYRFFSFFNTIPEYGLDRQSNPEPRLELRSPDHSKRLAALDAEVAALELARRKVTEEPNAVYSAEQTLWETGLRERIIDNWRPLLPVELESGSGATLTAHADNVISASGENASQDVYNLKLQTPADSITGLRLEALPGDGTPVQGAGRGGAGEFVLTRIELTARSANPERARARFNVPEAGGWWHLGPFVGGNLKEAFGKNLGPEPEADLSVTHAAGRLKWTATEALESGQLKLEGGVGRTVYLHRILKVPQAERAELMIGGRTALKVWMNGTEVYSRDKFQDAETVPVRVNLKEGENSLLVKLVAGSDDGSFHIGGEIRPVLEEPIAIAQARADSSRSGYDINGTLDDLIETGWSVDPKAHESGEPARAWFRFGMPVGFAEGTELTVRLIFDSPILQASLARFRLSMTTSADLTSFLDLPVRIATILGKPVGKRSEAEVLEVQVYHRERFVEESKSLAKILADKRTERREFEESIPVSMVMREMENPRQSHVLIRGEYNNPGDVVTPGVPESVFPWNPDLPPNRLGLARWLLDPAHPLTSRVLVNHLWQQHFGTGLVKTSEDFGAQGEAPSHPGLLDWLATEVVRSGWNIKQLHRLIATSATYRQDSVTTPEQLRHDPGNRLLAHFPRQRLEAEAVRDLSMSVSGLLSSKVGGPSVFPYQPPGLWEQVAFEGTRKWVQSQDSENYRRGLYVYWRRSVPYASFVTFDAPSRETCTVKRPRTNTPLQALVLMNDPVFLEAARSFGERIIRDGGATVVDRVRFAFRTGLGRMPTDEEQQRVIRAYETEFENFLKNRSDANQLIHVGATPPRTEIDPVELAAWTMVAQVLLNLDETITKG